MTKKTATTGAKKTDFYVVQLEKEAAQRKAARAMLAALQQVKARMASPDVHPTWGDFHTVAAAIAQAEAAGIKAEG